MDQKRKSASVQQFFEWLSRPAMVFYLMPALMILLTVGTLAQAQMGLYEAHKMFFSSFVFFVGPLPLPGGFTLLGILSANLLIKFLFFSDWNAKKSGIILSHLGALILLLGGLLTALFAREGYMVIAEGQKSPFVYDYHLRELTIYEDNQAVYTIPYEDLKRVKALTNLDLPFDINILANCDNCEIKMREQEPQGYDPAELQAMAQFMALTPKPKDKDAEANMTGLTMRLSGADIPESVYIAFEGMPKPVAFSAGGHEYKMLFGKQQRELPFHIELHDFVKEDYPGTMMAKSYHSDVSVLDDGVHWASRIEMNAPLRYKGYTFYQSSFDQSGEVEMTVLSVVENKGRIFPYIGTFVIALGLILQLLIVSRAKKGGA